MADREELSKIAYEMQVYREEVQLIQQQMGNLQLNYVSTESAVRTLENIGKLNKQEDVLLPIGAGAYIKAKIQDNEVALIDVGVGVIVEKPIPDAVQLLKSKMKEMDSLREKLQKNLEDISKKMKGLEESANKLVEKLKGAGVQPTKQDKEVHTEYG